MNDITREFAKQAGFYKYGDDFEDIIEKFAELIVEECAAQCWTVSELESRGFVVSECTKRMRKHFGVEE